MMTNNTFSLYHPILLFSFLFLLSTASSAQRGKDGAITISAPNTRVNEFTSLSADVSSGSLSISVANSALNTSGRFASPLAPGDLVMIVQMQGAAIKGNVSDSTWGEILSYNNCGLYEFQEVGSIPNGTGITFNCPITNNYTAAGKVQVVRVPRYSSLTINAGGVLSTDAWNGTTGGILVTEVSGAATINGSVDVSGTGFRGGAVENASNYPGGSLIFSSPSASEGSEKGESVAGYENDYNVYGGMYCKGAPANGGGGGDAHNAAGGGGANAGVLNDYTGSGNPDNSNPAWANAWNLVYSGFASTTSSGGGKGGYTYGKNNANALTQGAGDGAWGGDNRRDGGGRGGRPLDYSSGRIFLGGGGGAGDGNNSSATPGGSGGGLIYILSYVTISGSGSVTSNGSTAQSSMNSGEDAVGGGGGGGTIILNTTGAVSGITAIANGGAGGNQIIGSSESEGPGGGGSGGYIALSNGTITQHVLGGANGTSNSNGVTEFIPNGATAGGSGFSNRPIAPFQILATVNDTICAGQTAIVSASVTGNPSAVIVWYSTAAGGTPIGTGNTYTTPPLTSTTIYYASVCPGTYREPVTVCISPGSIAAFTAPNVCFNNPTPFADNSTGTPTQWNWNFGDGNNSSQQNPSHTYNTSGTFSVTLIVTGSLGCTDTFSQNVMVNPLPVSNFSSTPVCFGTPSCFTDMSTVSAGTISGWNWNFGDPSSANNISNVQNPCHVFTAAGNYSVMLTVSSNSGCQQNMTLPASVLALPAAGFTASNVCSNAPTLFTNASTGASQWNWAFGDGGISSAQNPSHTYLAFGTYTVTQIVTSAGGCKDTTSGTVTVYASPVVNFSINTVCEGLPTVFSDQSFVSGGTISGWNWSFGDGNLSTSQSPIHVYSSAGTFNVTLTVTSNNGCMNSVSLTALVHPRPDAAFSMSPGDGVQLIDEVQFTNQSSANASQWWWDFGDGNSSTGQHPSHLYGDTGTYIISLIVISPNGCLDTVQHPIEVRDYSFYIPNAFTPNGDWKNESFFGKGIGIKKYEMSIYDRWGRQVFHCAVNDLPQSAPCHWDGKVDNGASGQDVQEDVYVWKVNFTNVFDKQYSLIGNVTVVK